jgi:hypothetical protein
MANASRKQYPTVTIANGAALSNAIDLGDGELYAIFMPAGWTAAAVTFAAATSLAGTYNLVENAAGTELSLATPGASDVITLDPEAFRGLRFIKIRSGTAGTPVNQGAERVITLAVVEPAY